MKKCKRILAVISTVLVMASSFALPYGAAAEEVKISSTEQGQIVATLQGEEPAVAQQGGNQWLGKSFSLATPYVFEKANKNYLITLEVMVHQDYGFTDPAWMLKCMGDGNMVVKASDDTQKVNPISYTQMLQTASKLVEDEWMKVQIPLTEFAGADIQKLEFNTYVHGCKWDTQLCPADHSQCKYGCRISYRNVVVRDMSRTAQGGLSETVAVFGAQDVEYASSHPATGGAKAIIDGTNASYNLITSDMALADLNLEFDVMYEGDGSLAPGYIRNGQVRLYSGNTEHQGYNQWSNSTVKQEGVWYHFSLPLSGFTGGNALTDATAITRMYAFNYNDAYNGAAQAFTAKAKNMKITYTPAANLKTELEKAKNYIYDVDDKATAYETALNNARSLFANADATYDDFKTVLTEVQTAKAALTNPEYHGNEVVATLSQMPNDWKNLDGVANNDSGVHLAGDLNNYVLQMNVESLDGTALSSLFSGNFHWIELRNNKGAENVYGWNVNFSKVEGGDTSSCVVSIPLTPHSQINGEIAPGITLNRANLSAAGAEYFTRDTVLSYVVQSRMPNHGTVKTKANVTDVKIVDNTAKIVDENLKKLVQETLPAGKYTAASTQAYLALQAEAKGMVNDADATLQQKTQLIKGAQVAKNNFVAALTEYVQFGEPDKVAINYVNTGDSSTNAHNHGSRCVLPVTNRKDIPVDVSMDLLQLRVEMRLTRQDDGVDIQATFNNGGVQLLDATGKLVGTAKGWGSSGKGFVNGEWNTVWFSLSDFGLTEVSSLETVAKVQAYGYNDVKKPIRVEVQNTAIVDITRKEQVEALKAAFVDVTEGGKKDFTPDSLAAYQTVYNEWYPVYEAVDIDRAEAAITAMADAKKQLVCVDPDVMTFSNWNKTYKKGNDDTNQFYANWSGADQGLVDISNRNIENLRIRFDLTITAADTVAEPLTTLTMGEHRLAVRHSVDGEPGFNYQGRDIVKTLTVGETAHIDWALTDMTDKRNGDNLLDNIIFWIFVNELSGVPVDDYTMTIANARVVDVTKETMLAELTKAANATLTEMGDADGVVYDETSADALKAAQAAAKEVVALENPTYAQLADAQKAIDDAKVELKLIGHTLMTFPNFANNTKNFMYQNPKNVYMNWSGAKEGATDLSRYNKDNLVLRINFFVGTTDAENYPVPENVTINNTRLGLASRVDGKEKAITFPNTYNGTYNSQNGFIEIPLSKANDNGIAWQAVKDIIWVISVAEFADDVSTDLNDKGEAKNNSGHYYINATSARVVDIAAEKNLGSVTVEGNGYVDITGGLVNGTTDTLTAKTTATDGTVFDHWVVNGEIINDAAIDLEVNGQQQVTAVFAQPSTEVTVEFLGKYNETFATQTVKSADELKALLNGGLTAPIIHGYTFVSWDVEDADLLYNENIGGTVKIQAIYNPDTQTTYALTFDGEVVAAKTADGDIGTDNALAFDQRVTVTALATDKTVAYWVLDGAKVGFGQSAYTFYISGQNNIAVVYEGDADYEEPANDVVLQQAFLNTNGSTYTFTVVAQTSIPNGNVQAYGVLYSNRYSELCKLTDGDAVPTDAGLYVNVASSKTVANKQYMTSLLNVETGKYRYARAYAVLDDGTTVYSDAFVAVHTGSGNAPTKLVAADYAG